MRNLFPLISTVLALAPLAAAQVDEAWSTTLDRSPIADVVRDGYVDAFGTTTLVGSRSVGPQDRVATIARVDAFSSVVFERDFVLPGAITEFVDVEPDGQRGFYVRGNTVDTLGVASALLVRYDADGNVLWSLTDAALVAKDIALDPSGDVWMVGNSGADVGIRRYTSSGTPIVSTVWNGAASLADEGNAIAPDGFGGAYVAGRTHDTLSSNWSALALKLDSAGNAVWSRTSTATDVSTALSVAVGPAGHVYFGGTFSLVLSPPHYATAAYDQDGNLLWWDQFSTLSHPIGEVTHLFVDAHGDIVAVGNGWESDTDGDVIIRKLTPAGAVLWTRSSATPGIGKDEVESAVIDDAGDVFIAGTTGLHAHPFYVDALVMRVDRDGVVRWKTTFGTPGVDEVATVVGTSAPGTVFVAANVPDGADTDVRVVRYDESIAPFCFGDGSARACPCGNDSTTWDRAGCMNSLGQAGRLVGGGTPSLTSDTLVLNGSGMPSSSALYFQGAGALAGGSGTTFGDGLLCVAGPIVRLGTRTNVGGQSSYPSGGSPSISVRGGVVAPGERTYQVWYRNAASFCTSAPFNLTNGVRVTWAP